MAKVLIIDDEPDLLKALAMILESKGIEVTSLSDAVSASKLIPKEKFDIIISDIRMQPMDGMQFLDFVRQHGIQTPVIMLTAYATLDVALQAIKKGAFDFITKPFKPDALLELVKQVLEQPVISSSDIPLDESVHREWLWNGLVVRSHQMKDVCSCLERIAPTDELVLLVGEEGTGRRFVAEIIHKLSPRAAEPFLAIDCARAGRQEIERLLSVPPSANGTVLAENIDALTPEDGNLLAVRIKERIPASGKAQTARYLATCRELNEAASRVIPLAAFTISIPPLRERIQDLLPLISYILHQENKHGKFPSGQWTISAEAYDQLSKYHAWPGNVDELRRIVAGALAKAARPQISIEHIPARLRQAKSAEERSSSEYYSATELRGKSFRDYVRRKQIEMKEA